MKKTLFFALCVISLLFTLVIFGASADEAATPVSNAAEFKAMTTGGNYILTADIDFEGEEFSKFIFSEFHGTLDGNGKTLKNFTIVGGTSSYNAIFATSTGTLIVKNLNIGTAEAPVTVSGSVKDAAGSAVLLGEGNKEYSAIFSNVDVFANIKIEQNEKCKIGGFVAQSWNTIIEDSTFNGSITVGNETMHTEYRNVAGFVSSHSTGMLVISDSTNNASITLGASTSDSRAAGFVGYADRIFNLINCVNNGNMTVLDGAEGASAPQVGGFAAHSNHYAGYYTNCVNNGTLTATVKTRLGNIVGRATAGAYILGTTSGENACGSFENNSYAYVEGDYTDSIAISTVEEFLKIESGKKYHLTQDIDFGGRTFDNAIFCTELKQNTDGSWYEDGMSFILDGCGHKVYGFNLEFKDSRRDTGFLTITKARWPFVLTNIQFGLPENLIKLTVPALTATKSHAIVLAGVNLNGTAWLNNVSVYGDIVIDPTAERGQAGGIIAYTRHVTLDNCNYYGKITLGDFETNKTASRWWNVAAIGGTVQEVAYVFNCNNYAELKLGNSGAEVRLGGILGYCVKPFVVANSNNYGKISVVTNDTSITASKAQVAGIVVECNRQSDSLIAVPVIYNCQNYGQISSDDVVAVNWIGGILGRIRSAKQVLIVDCGNHVVPTGVNANELLGKKDSGNYTSINFTDAAHQPTPPTSDMNIVYVLGVCMIALVGTAVIVYRKRNCLSK